MTIELWIMASMLFCLVLITLLLLSVLKGIADILEQRKEMHIKHCEWINEIYDWIYQPKRDSGIRVEDEDENGINHSDMYREGIKEIENKNKEKSKN